MFKLNKGDKIAIVSLSSGILGESFCSHQVDLAKKRLEELGLIPVFMPNSLKGIKELEANPILKVEDLIKAFSDKTIKGIITAIGGVDTYKTVEYILENKEYVDIIKNNKKFFMGYSDTTTNHLMLNKLGLSSFYGQSILTDISELDLDMLEYSKNALYNLFTENEFIYSPSKYWYEERKDFSKKQLNIPRVKHKELRGYELLKGNKVFSGRLIGGCIESICRYLDEKNFSDVYLVNSKYGIIPKDNKEKIVFLETSENKISKEQLKFNLELLKEYGFFDNINGLLIGKPQDEMYYEEYKKVYLEVFKDRDINIAYNLNFGHSYPHMIMQYDAMCHVDLENNKIKIGRI
ncbi:S66 family peptidase [Oceanivirga miroungae]|uniref:Peptidase U61 LD-carboxypeptidase A n=1 Tax=Oceanivirga miroungae TaxID=1130046 RepID=A0A6I8M9R5_9FUSO|nr:S66 peptidase family protein [Oceanivirga miroungae]VWL85558.1 peptidase U61 LD-carboxypeptidase A [Oceanivirga miroungae]